jgi:hypothetical protein
MAFLFIKADYENRSTWGEYRNRQKSCGKG